MKWFVTVFSLLLIPVAPQARAQVTVGEVFYAIHIANQVRDHVSELAAQHGGFLACSIMATQGCRKISRCQSIHHHLRRYQAGEPGAAADMRKKYVGTSKMSTQCVRAMTGWSSPNSMAGQDISRALLAMHELETLSITNHQSPRDVLLRNARTEGDRQAVLEFYDGTIDSMFE